MIDGDEIKRQAHAGQMGEQLYAVVYKKRVEKTLKSGKRGKDKWVRGYRAPRPEDDNAAEIAAKLAEKLPEWEAFDIVPSENFQRSATMIVPFNTVCRCGATCSPRANSYAMARGVEVFREMLDADRANGELDEVRKAAYGYLALCLDKMLNYNSRMSVWMPTREVVQILSTVMILRSAGPTRKWRRALWVSATTGPLDRPPSASTNSST